MKNHEQVIIALLSEPTISSASKKLKIDQSTIFRMMQDPKFQEEYKNARKQLLENAMNRIQIVSGEAVETLRTIMLDESNPAGVRVNSAKAILEMSFRTFEMQDIIERIQRIEEANKTNDRRFA